jgi:hypothetical protein
MAEEPVCHPKASQEPNLTVCAGRSGYNKSLNQVLSFNHYKFIYVHAFCCSSMNITYCVVAGIRMQQAIYLDRVELGIL